MKVLTSTLALVWLCALPADAQVKLDISNGRVNLEATNVPARQILAEWARIGGTRIVGGEKVTGGPLTLKLVDMPERQALEIILRSAAGFMAAPRLASATPGASAYDRILIMATSSAPAPAATTAGRGANSANNNVNTMNGVRRVPQRPPNLPPSVADDPPADDDQRADDDQADTGMSEPPVFTFPAPGAQPGTTPVFTPIPANTGQPGTVAPVITLQPGQNGPSIYNFVPSEGQQPAPTTTPNNPFGVIGAPQPGMIQMPAPTPAQPGRPPTTRPPGGE